MMDANACFDVAGNQIEGDKCIWYLCTNEKSGYIHLKTPTRTHQLEWGLGGSNPKIIKKFIEILQEEGLITPRQYANLLQQIEIAKTLGDMYEIPNYLETRRQHKKWIPKITQTKKKMREMATEIAEKLSADNYSVVETSEYERTNTP